MKRRIFSVLSIFLFLGLSFGLVSQLFSESEKILAKVGEAVLTQRDMDELLSKYARLKKDKPFTPEEKKTILDNMIKGEVITQEAEREKLDQNAEIKAKLKVYRSELLIQEYVKTKIQPFVTVTDEEVEEKMKQNPNLVPKESLTLAEILVKTEKEAEEVYEELKKGQDFSKLAVQKSISPTGNSGGHIRAPVSKGQLPKALDEAAFSLKKGEFSKPIKTEQGFYILYLEDRKERSPEEIKKLEATIKGKIKNIEQSMKTQAIFEKKVEELKKNKKIEVYYDQIQ